jgi:PAS domain S-box-containing protein
MQAAPWIVIGCLIVWIGVLVRRLKLLGLSRRTSEEQYRIIFETVTDGLMINALDGTVVEANPAACQMHGYRREEFLGQKSAEFVHPDSLHLFRECIEALKAGRHFHCFAQDLRKDGTAFDVEVDGVPFLFGGRPHLLGIVRDITRRKQAEADLLESEMRFRLLAENAPGVIYLCHNDARYTMIFISENVARLTGHARREFLSDRVSFVDLYAPEDKPSIRAEVEQALSEKRAYHLRYRMHHKSGEIRWVEETGVGVWHDEKLAYLEGFLTDVTDRVQSEEALQQAQQALFEQQQKENERVTAELARAEDRLVQSTKLATIGQMAAQIAHEIRNPLGAIHNAAFFARRKMPSQEALAHENLDLISREVAMCVSIIENILSITRLQPPRKAPFDFGPFVQEAFERLRQSQHDGQSLDEVRCVYDGDRDPFPLLADPVQFRQVFDNLLKNAVEAMQGPGEIRINARQTPDGPCIEVSDTGPGIPTDHAEKIFEVFETSKIKGSGLGLGISRHIIESHGGTLTVKPRSADDSKDSQGATFRICLPENGGEQTNLRSVPA